MLQGESMLAKSGRQYSTNIIDQPSTTPTTNQPPKQSNLVK